MSQKSHIFVTRVDFQHDLTRYIGFRPVPPWGYARGGTKKGGRGDGGGGELLFRPISNYIMFNLSQKMVFCQSRPVPPWGTQGGELFQGPGRGGMVFLGPLEMIPPIRNLD